MCAESHGFLFLPFTMVRTQEKEMKEHEINARVLKKKKKGKIEIDKNSQECFLKKLPVFPKVNAELD